MVVRSVVRRSYYRDSMALMGVAEALRARAGVREAAALMGTPANLEILAGAGLATSDAKEAGSGDLVLVVAADSDAGAEQALAEAGRILDEQHRARETTGRPRPRTLDSALQQMPDANLVSISVPGAWAKLEALLALRRGLHVFLFSDNVSLADEIELKRLAVSRRLLCMGPDCGTAYLNGVGLGFANVATPGRVGCVAASGTGLQAVASHLTALGEGISHGVGVGGRDLSEDVGGAMALFALEALAADRRTELIVVVSKPPAPSVLPRLEAALATVGKPVVVCCLGASRPDRAGLRWVTTLEDAATAAVATLAGRGWNPRSFADARSVEARLARLERAPSSRRGALLGLYTGGTLAHEATLLLEPILGPVASSFSASNSTGHRVVDLGGDDFTIGRPHPMIDPEARAARVRDAGRTAEVSVLLLDLVLGRGAHPDPARPLVAAVDDARRAAAADGRSLVVVASVIGTDRDPQGLRAQVAQLEAAGVEVLPSNAQAARFAALAIRPELAPALLAGPR